MDFTTSFPDCADTYEAVSSLLWLPAELALEWLIEKKQHFFWGKTCESTILKVEVWNIKVAGLKGQVAATILSISRGVCYKYIPQYIHTALLASEIMPCFTSAAWGHCVLGQKKPNSCVFRSVLWLQGQAGDWEAEMWLQPSNRQKAGESLQRSWKNTSRSKVWSSREERQISQGVGSSCRGRFPLG